MRKGMGACYSDIQAEALANMSDTSIIVMDPKSDMKSLEKPYTQSEMKELRDENGYVTGRVAVPLSDIIDNDLEGFLALLAEKLVNNDCLMDINYKAIGIENTESGDANIIIEVSGDVSEILEEDEEE